MSAIQWAARKIYFGKSSPISGRFDIDRYPFLRKPLASLDNIHCREMTIYKAASSLGTVFLQIAMAYLLDRRHGDMLFVAQTDDDAKEWSVTRGKEFLTQVPSLVEMTCNPKIERPISKYPIQNQLIIWPHQFLIVTGPGESAQQSKQVRYLITDEAHVYKPGTLAAFDARTGERWDRLAIHASTASNSSVLCGEDVVAFEINVRYFSGQQDEWNQMCPWCNRLFWPLWENYATERYNGERIFRWTESQSETEELESIRAICPHCDKEIFDKPIARREMNLGGGYVAENPNHDQSKLSFRWSRLAPDWIPWRNVLEKHKAAMVAARNGDMSVYAEFTKKVLCMTWRGHVPNLADAHVSGDYKLGDEWT